MSVLGFFIRFTVTYTLVLVAAGITVTLLGIENATSLNIPILAGISYWCFSSYSSKNSRVIEGGEKWKLIFTALAGDVVTSVLLVTPTMLATEMPIKLLFISVLVVIPMHLLLLIAVNFGVKKQLIKQRPELAQS